MSTPTTTTPQVRLDQTDERLQQSQGLRGALESFGRSVRAGDVGALPVVVGLLVIGTIFQVLNPVFLSSGNLVNLVLDSCAVGVSRWGSCVSCSSARSTSRSARSAGSPQRSWQCSSCARTGTGSWPCWRRCWSACAIGLLYGVLLTKFGMPSFVASLSGLLAFLGLQLAILGDRGSVNLPFDSTLVSFAQLNFVPPWLSYVLAAAAAAALFVSGYENMQRRRRANLSARSMNLLVIRSVALLVGLEFVVWYLNQDRGVGWMVVFFVSLVLALNYAITRTKWGRSLMAVGGNAEAARRSGINVRNVYLSAFVLCSLFAAIGGVLAAGRLASANLSSGTGDVNLNAIAAAVIGGTSLFGGRGSAFSALLGTLVIASIASGLTLLNLDSSYRFVITGLVLAVAVAIDSLARKSRASHGRA